MVIIFIIAVVVVVVVVVVATVVVVEVVVIVVVVITLIIIKIQVSMSIGKIKPNKLQIDMALYLRRLDFHPHPCFFLGEGPRSRCYGRTAALRLIVQPCDEDDSLFVFPCNRAPVE